MAVELKLSKFDNTPWGFRLVGGADFDTPLTVIKVSEGSLAEEAGMRLGDTVVRVNEIAVAELSHAQAHDLIRESGNNFTLAVFRGKVGDPLPIPKPLVTEIFPKSAQQQALELLENQDPVTLPPPGEEPVLEYALPREEIVQKVEVSTMESSSIAMKSETSAFSSIIQDGLVSSKTEVKQQSEFSSSKVEQSAMSVTSMRGPPPSLPPASPTTRAVQLQYTVDMNADPNIVPKPKAQPGEVVLEDHWSSFLQRPKNPIPKSSKQDEAERAKVKNTPYFRDHIYVDAVCFREPPYRVVITKIKRKLSRDLNEYKEKGLLAKASEITTEDTQNINVSQPIKLEQTEGSQNGQADPNQEAPAEPAAVEAEPEPLPTEDPKVEDPVEQPVVESTAEVVEETAEIKESTILTETQKREQLTKISTTATSMLSQFSQSAKVVSETDLSMEQQLAQVQKQLLALAQLPAAIQATLNAVTEQLAVIAKPGDEVQDAKTVEQAEPKIRDEGDIPAVEDLPYDPPESSEAPKLAVTNENGGVVQPIEGGDKIPVIIEEKSNEISQLESIAATPGPTPTPEPELSPEEQDKLDKKLKAERMLSRKQEESQIFEDMENRKRNKKSHFPSAPMNRPIVLPGGKKWREPDDVIPRKINARKYTDEVIAETISSQSEIITGTTLGINFLKYQPKPPKNLDHLKESEVYKMVHALDLPTRGIAGRPSLVVAEEDVYSLKKQIDEDSNVVQVQLPPQNQKPPQLEP